MIQRLPAKALIPICIFLLAFSCSSGEKAEIDPGRMPDSSELSEAPSYLSIKEARKARKNKVYKLVLKTDDQGSLPSGLGRFTYLASLDVANNGLSEVPDVVSDFHYLQGFYASGNNLREFPQEILLLPVLRKVDLSANQILRIPPEIKGMGQLTRLSINNNFVVELPAELYELKNLTVLELGQNLLQEIPEGIAGLKSLRQLDLARNQIKTLPRELATLSGTLTELDVQGNQIPMEEIHWLVEAMPHTKILY